MGRYGHSEERPKIEPLFTMTNSQFISKNHIEILYTFYGIMSNRFTYTKTQNTFSCYGFLKKVFCVFVAKL